MKIARITAIVTLAFLGISSIVGAIPLIIDPSGGLLRMPLSLIRHSPFQSFLIPALILLLANGFLSIVILFAEVRRARGHALMVIFQGCVLAGWITIEVIIMRTVVSFHYFYWGVALVLVLSGLALRRTAGRARACSHY